MSNIKDRLVKNEDGFLEFSASPEEWLVLAELGGQDLYDTSKSEFGEDDNRAFVFEGIIVYCKDSDGLTKLMTKRALARLESILGR